MTHSTARYWHIRVCTWLALGWGLFWSADMLAGSDLPALREAIVHIRHAGVAPLSLQISWDNAWIADSQEERLYLQHPDGRLLKRLVIPPTQTAGRTRVELPATAGDYRLVIPGASFRNYRLKLPDGTPVVLEPAKIHQAMNLQGSTVFYFRLPANSAPQLNIRNHGKVRHLRVVSLDPAATVELALETPDATDYGRYQSLQIPPHSADRVIQLVLEGHGKVSFWLDGTPNLFALQPGELFNPQGISGETIVTVGEPMGDAPWLGAALPFAEPPPFTHDVLDAWQMGGTNLYFFRDTLTRNPDADLSFLDIYQNRFKLHSGVTIMANTGRNALIGNTAQARDFLSTYLRSRRSRQLLTQMSVAFADEPNLNYQNLDDYVTQFVELAQSLRHHPDPLVSSTRIAAPESSGFWNGPTRDGSHQRRGADLATRLLRDHYELFDVLSWHEWQVRGLMATEWYHDSVYRAWQLMKQYQPVGQPEKPLVIAQTNPSSGYSLSPYEQDTFFAALWWTSVVIQSARSGKLDGLVWFKAADDGRYSKGLIRLRGHGYVEKPVSMAMKLATRHLAERVLATTSNHVEVDVLASLDNTGRLHVLGVNKGNRVNTVTLQLPPETGALQLHLLNESQDSHTEVVASGGRLTLVLPPETLFGLRAPATTP